MGTTSIEALAGRRGAVAVLAAHQAAQLAGREELRAWPPALAYAAVLVAAALLPPRRLSWACWALVPLGVWQCAWTFPRTANHAFLGVLVAALLALERDDEDGRAFTALALISFFWSGVQKVVHGQWFDGAVLGWLISSRPDVGAQLGPLVDAPAAARLAGGDLRLGGAWRVASNAVWLLELGAPALWRVRAQAWWLLLGGTWGVQLIAHEWEFGLLLSLLALSSAGPRVRAVGRATVLAGVALLLSARLGALPVFPGWLDTVNR